MIIQKEKIVVMLIIFLSGYNTLVSGESDLDILTKFNAGVDLIYKTESITNKKSEVTLLLLDAIRERNTNPSPEARFNNIAFMKELYNTVTKFEKRLQTNRTEALAKAKQDIENKYAKLVDRETVKFNKIIEAYEPNRTEADYKWRLKQINVFNTIVGDLMSKKRKEIYSLYMR